MASGQINGSFVERKKKRRRERIFTSYVSVDKNGGKRGGERFEEGEG